MSNLPKHMLFYMYAKSHIRLFPDMPNQLTKFSDLFSMKKTKVTPFWQFPMLNK